MYRSCSRSRATPAWFFWLLALGLLFHGAPGLCADEHDAHLYVHLDPRGGAIITLTADAPPPAPETLRRSLSRALNGTFQNVDMETDEEGWYFYGRSKDAFRRRGLLIEGQINPAFLVQMLRPLGVNRLMVRIRHPRSEFTQCAGAGPPTLRRRFTYYEVLIATNAPPRAATGRPLHLVYGHPPAFLVRAVALLFVLLLVPVGLTLWMRRAALRAKADPAVVWFGFQRFSQIQANALFLLWLAAVLGLKTNELSELLLNPPTAEAKMAIGVLFVSVPPTLIQTLCVALSHPVFARVRGLQWTRADLLRQSLLAYANLVAPLVLGAVGFGSLLDRQPPRAVAWFAAAFVAQMVLRQLLANAAGSQPIAITVGDLRDRVFELAQKANVKIQQVYYLPTGKARMANAFAALGNNVVLTDILVQHLSKREVDAVIAHELAHLRHRHPLWMKGASVAVVFLPTAVVLGLGLGTRTDFERWALVLPFLLGGGTLLLYLLSRSFERTADADAAAITGDAEALVTGLARLMRLNQLPIEWNKWGEQLLTHPSTVRRATFLARRGAISPERLAPVLQATADPADRYRLPPATAEQSGVFATPFKHRVLLRNFWLLTAVVVLTPALVATLVERAGWEGPTRWAAYGAGFAGTVLLYLLVANRVSVWGYAVLERRLRQKFREEGLVIPSTESIFVGLAPDAPPNLYEGFADWDVGFLVLEGGRLRYVGDLARFALPKQRITAVGLGPGLPDWLRTERVHLTWQNGEGLNSTTTISLRPAAARSLKQLKRDTPRLAQRLQTWREEPDKTELSLSPEEGFDPPCLGAVTSMSPREVGRLPVLLTNLRHFALVALAVSVLWGLPLHSLNGAGWYVVFVGVLMTVYQWWPYWLHRHTGGENSGKW